MKLWLTAFIVMVFGFLMGVLVTGVNIVRSESIINRVVSLNNSINKQEVIIDRLNLRIVELEKCNHSLENKVSMVSSENLQIKKVIGAITQLISQIIHKINKLDEKSKFSI